MNKELKVKWVEALRSGKYKQTQGKLKDNFGYCCLGVLCEISRQGTFKNGEFLDIKEYISYANLTLFMRSFTEIPPDRENHLALMNDGGSSFEEIADWIEENL